MVSNEQKSWLDTLETRISPPMTVAERVAAPASPQAWQDILEHFFRQSYLLTAMPFFQLLVQRLAHAFQVRGVYLALFPEGSNVQTLAFWLDTKLVENVAYDLTTAPCVDVVQGGDLQYVEAVTAVYPAFCAQIGVYADCYLGIPLTSVNGQLLGHLVLLHDEPFQLPLSAWSVWPLVLARTAIELDRWQTAVQQTSAIHDLQRRAEQLAALYETALDLTPSPDWPQLIHVVGERISSLLHVHRQALWLELHLLDANNHNFHLLCRHPQDSKPIYLCESPTPELRHYVAQTGEAHVAAALPQDAMIYLMPDEARSIHIIRSSVLLPLLAGERRVGLLYIGLRDCLSFTPDQMSALMAFGDMLADLLQRIHHIRDLQTRLVQSQKKLVDVEARCQALDQLRTKLIHDVTQELFTPITSVRLYLDLLAYCRLDQNAQRYVEVLRVKTQQLIQFAEDALHLSRWEQRSEKIQFQPICLHRDLAHMISLYAQLAQQASLGFTFHPGDKRCVRGEANQIRQAVSVLLDNAIAYTPVGRIAVRLRANKANTQLCVQVEDTGVGIGVTEMPYLFDRFYRGKYAGQQQIPGRGLGLSIALEIARLHGGRLEVESEPGQGSVFRLWLPIAAENDMTTLDSCE